jgi:hypothetical protein
MTWRRGDVVKFYFVLQRQMTPAIRILLRHKRRQGNSGVVCVNGTRRMVWER